MVKPVKTRATKDPDAAVKFLQDIYDTQTKYLRDCFDAYCDGTAHFKRVAAFYPFVRITTKLAKRSDSRFSYGFAAKPGTYETTVTRPDMFAEYYREQFRLIIKNHNVHIEVGLSDTPIPLHFALGEDFHLEQKLDEDRVSELPDFFDVPDLDILDDEIANSGSESFLGDEVNPLALFIAPRIDLSLQRLKHYTGTLPSDFQNYVLFTNYQFYIDEFIKIGAEEVNSGAYDEFIQPSGDRLPQMPAYHLKREGNNGITMVNIGVGPSNAKTITDHVAVLRPHAWLMLGHCAGLRQSQRLGDYVLAHGYLREDNILDEFLPPSIPIPALAEIQQALEQAVATVTGNAGYDLKKVMRTGTVATTDDRNWELKSYLTQNVRLSQSRAIALDMESGTIAANGFRFRVPYGTLLCVSDKPLHGQLKLPGMADSFYRERVEQHLKIGLLTMTLLRDLSPEKLHSRKLRSFDETAFQ